MRYSNVLRDHFSICLVRLKIKTKDPQPGQEANEYWWHSWM